MACSWARSWRRRRPRRPPARSATSGATPSPCSRSAGTTCPTTSATGCRSARPPTPPTSPGSTTSTGSVATTTAQFLWPGYGENSRVLEWIFDRCSGEGKAVETPIGNVPTPTPSTPTAWPCRQKDMAELLRVDLDEWRSEVPLIREHYAGLGDRLPVELDRPARRARASPGVTQPERAGHEENSPRRRGRWPGDRSCRTARTRPPPRRSRCRRIRRAWSRPPGEARRAPRPAAIGSQSGRRRALGTPVAHSAAPRRRMPAWRSPRPRRWRRPDTAWIDRPPIDRRTDTADRDEPQRRGQHLRFAQHPSGARHEQHPHHGPGHGGPETNPYHHFAALARSSSKAMKNVRKPTTPLSTDMADSANVTSGLVLNTSPNAARGPLGAFHGRRLGGSARGARRTRAATAPAAVGAPDGEPQPGHGAGREHEHVEAQHPGSAQKLEHADGRDRSHKARQRGEQPEMGVARGQHALIDRIPHDRDSSTGTVGTVVAVPASVSASAVTVPSAPRAGPSPPPCSSCRTAPGEPTRRGTSDPLVTR